MGTDIDRWIECRRRIMGNEEWEPVMKMGFLYLGRDWHEGDEWNINEKLFRVERLKRKTGIVYWEATFKLLEILAGLYGDENVRLVVWFEN